MRTIRQRWLVAVVFFPLLHASKSMAAPAIIAYQPVSFGGGHWRYEYDVSNVFLIEPLKEFTIWFDEGLFQNLALATPNPPASDWDELVIQPSSSLHTDGFYDAAAFGSGIGAGTHVLGFAIEFDWLGTGSPGSQRFDIVDPVTFETRYADVTVPEPITLALLASGLTLLRRPVRTWRFACPRSNYHGTNRGLRPSH